MGFDKIHRKLVVKTGTPVYNLKEYSQTITPVGVATVSVADQTFTVTGLLTTDRILAINTENGTPCGIVGMRVSAADTLAIKFVNPTGATATPSAGTFKIIVIRT